MDQKRFGGHKSDYHQEPDQTLSKWGILLAHLDQTDRQEDFVAAIHRIEPYQGLEEHLRIPVCFPD